MSSRREYEIAFVGLKPGIHQFLYEIDDRFFEEFGKQDFKNCKAAVKLELEKNTGFMMLKFEVGGTLGVLCDRCGNDLPLELWDEFEMLVKMTDEPEKMNEEEESPDVFYISRTESHLHVKNWIFEFINLSIPMQKMCKESEMGGPHCNKEVLARLAQLNPQPNENKSIWKGLDKFRND
nr:YceD family protein [uncultured Lacibacter sp.]